MSITYFDTIIVGAGISGISAAHYLQTNCPNKTYTILEGRKNIGGTWDLFRYPGIRSDSDMYTYGFAFKPWVNPKVIAPRKQIIAYLEETIQEEGIDKHIKFEHKLLKASWSSQTAKWLLTIKVAETDSLQFFSCSFLSLCMGYYDYENGYTPIFEGKDDFKGTIIHPQKWDETLNYSNKKIVVIGSGATAITLIPQLAKKAAQVTLLQRSPTYIVSMPKIDKFAVWINKKFSRKKAHKINRFRYIMFQQFTYTLLRLFPLATKKLIKFGVAEQLGKGFDVDKHFNPSYKPWDQRLCIVPDGDFFKAIKANKAKVVTDNIVRFTQNGIQLKSGELLEADIIVTATGLNFQLFSNIVFEIDGKQIDVSKKVIYKSLMFNNIPNMTFTFGYTNASWTLKCDMTNQYTCKLINFMDNNGFKQCMAVQNNPNIKLKPFLNFTPNYLLRVIDKLPKMGDKNPWRVKQNYYYDKKMYMKSPINDDVLKFK